MKLYGLVVKQYRGQKAADGRVCGCCCSRGLLQQWAPMGRTAGMGSAIACGCGPCGDEDGVLVQEQSRRCMVAGLGGDRGRVALEWSSLGLVQVDWGAVLATARGIPVPLGDGWVCQHAVLTCP